MASMRNGRPAEILLVEDNPGDVRLAQEALKDAGHPNRLSVARDGVEAMAFLRREGPYGDAPRPDLILLDLNLPRKNGREVLAEIKQDHRLRKIPVVVLTTSRAQDDVQAAYGLHVNSYIVKPADLDEFQRVIRSIEDFWLTVVQLPTDEGFT